MQEKPYRWNELAPDIQDIVFNRFVFEMGVDRLDLDSYEDEEFQREVRESLEDDDWHFYSDGRDYV